MMYVYIHRGYIANTLYRVITPYKGGFNIPIGVSVYINITLALYIYKIRSIEIHTS